MADAVMERWYAGEAFPEAIIPVPLHRDRWNERGFNQAMEIAKPITKISGIPLAWRLVERIKATRPQSELRAEERIRNVSGAFEINSGNIFKHVAVVDDVMTTGETMKVLCRELKRYGVEKIDVWVCARV